MHVDESKLNVNLLNFDHVSISIFLLLYIKYFIAHMCVKVTLRFNCLFVVFNRKSTTVGVSTLVRYCMSLAHEERRLQSMSNSIEVTFFEDVYAPMLLLFNLSIHNKN